MTNSWGKFTPRESKSTSTYSTHDSVLLDTDVYSYLAKPDPVRAAIYLPHVQSKIVAVSFVTVGEMLFGAIKKNWGPQRIASLIRGLRSVVLVSYDFKLCIVYGELKAKLRESGKNLQDNDLWIAACAIRHSIPLISNNRAHFKEIPGLILI